MQRSREERLRRIKKAENRMLAVAAGLCVTMAGAGWVYKRNNAIPNLVVPETARPAKNGHDDIALAFTRLGPWKSEPPVDSQTDTSGSTRAPDFPSRAYEARYPLERQLKYLQSNASALILLRQGLALPYVQPPEHDASPTVDYTASRNAARLLVVEARVRARQGDFNGAAGSLEDATRLGYAIPSGGVLISALVGQAIRRIAREEFNWLAPRLSPSQARLLALRLEAMHEKRVLMPQVLEEEKRAMQRFMLHLIRIGDWRVLVLPVTGSFGEQPKLGKNPSLEQTIADHQKDLDEVPRWLQMYMAWRPKASIMAEHARCLDWQIENARLPYPQQAKKSPFSDNPREPIDFLLHPVFMGAPMQELREGALDKLTFTSLALRAFRADHKYLPRHLSELVPRYLARVPSDPFDPRRPLGYKPQPIRAYLMERKQKLVQPPTPVVVTAQGLATPTPLPWSGSASPGNRPSPTPTPLTGHGPPALAPAPAPTPRLFYPPDESEGVHYPRPVPPEPPQPAFEDVTRSLGAPWTLWSIGPDGRDDNGLPFRKQGGSTLGSSQFKISSTEPEARFDIVAGINR